MNTPVTDAPFAFPIRIYWEDTDAGGIVFYANYLKFFERARTEWLRSLGVQQQALRIATGGMFVVTETALKYHRPARLDDRLLVTATIKEIGRAGMILEQSALCIQEHSTVATHAPVLLCDGSIRIGWVDAGSMRPARIPAEVRHALASTKT